MSHTIRNVALATFSSVLLLISSPAAAQDPLTERGIDPNILDVMVSDLSENLGYVHQADIVLITQEDTFRDRALIVYEPRTEYGIDLYMKFDERELETMAPRKFRGMLENRMRLQHRLRTMEFQYDPSTIEVESQDGDKAVILFRYRKTALPQEVAWMRFLQGRVWVEGSQVKRIELKTDEGRRFLADSMRVLSMEMTGEFTRASNGQDLLTRVESKIDANYRGWRLFRWNERFQVEFSTRAISYTEADGTVVFSIPDDEPDILQDSDDLSTVRVKLDRPFPIWGKEARAEGFDLPKPYGLSFLYTPMTTRMDFTSFEINGEQQAIEALFSVNGSGIDVTATVPQVRADWFILPFVNVMVLAGTAEADGDLLVNTTGLGQLVGLPPTIEETIDLDLSMAGVGVALAAGYKNYIAAATVTYMKTFTSGADSESTALSFTPLVGYQFLDWRMQFLIGAEYLELQKTMEGSIALPGDAGNLDFNIGVESENWAWRTGIRKEIGTSWESLISYSWGEDRDGWVFMIGYRW